jgi:aminoglycoside phosphotransferase (APT) family kinase protein
MLLNGDLSEADVMQFGQILGSIHAKSHAAVNDLDPEFADQRYFESLRLEPYYEYTAARIPASARFIGRLLAETRQVRVALVHGDYSPKNVLVTPGGMLLLDHEVSHIGDPAFDVGFGLTHLLSKGNHLRNRLDAFASAAARFWHTYQVTSLAAQWTSGLEKRSISHTLACLLARVGGRSPLEYLDERARTDQAKVVLHLMSETPDGLCSIRCFDWYLGGAGAARW